MAIENLITDHLDLWSATVRPKSSAGRGASSKLELTGIKKLRELILELAVRGKLVPQDPSDEPASVLLERIAAEKVRLVKEGKIKKPKALPKVSEQDKPFELPKGWVITRLGEIGIWATGNGFPTNEQGLEDLEILFCKVSDMNLDGNERFILKTMNTVSEDTARRIKLNLHKAGAVIFPKIGGAIATNKRRIISKATAIDNNCLGITPYSEVASDYLFFLLTSIDMAKYQVGTSVPALSQGTLELIPIGIPSIDEQHRIVAKVDELMALCDQLEQRSESQLAAHQTLVETLLATLIDCADADELAQNWARLSTHFDTLFTTEASIDALKQTILQMAVTGTLVSWGNNVREEKLKNCISFGPRNGFSPKETTEDTGFYVLKLGATSYGCLNLTEIKNIDIAIEKESHLFIRKNDILIQRGNSANYVGSNCLVECDVDGIIYPDLMMKIMVNHKVSAKYLSLWLSSPRSRRFMWDRMTGTSGTMPKISKKVVEEIPVMVPLMACQNDIVAKVDELMTLCDQLKSRLQTSQQTQLALAESLVAGALS
ncbi:MULTISPECIES: restriction endonuclease subunit S [Aeromonas]|uniref:restriction endonuclease subunit S n=1 Tax=Aeromonas TaxID=642 RepID=UPI0012EEEA9A|nr:restriction endonuclease subunit S [Aeromonas salmonicida]VXA80908.1 Subunit S of type I restriction-modification system [Aeromonas salmonicida]